MKKLLLVIIALLVSLSNIFADEGMWMLPALQKMNIKDMQSLGLELTAEEIYSANNNSLKDAIVIFGRGCTGEIVSSEGLIFTNHHCGYDAIQSLSTIENDYLKNGFWSADKKEEIPVPGLTIRFIRNIEDVSDQVLKKVKEQHTQSERELIIGENIENIKGKYKKKYNDPNLTININSFFGGNQYFLFAIEEFRDIRLVGTPPSSIGKYGGETDNWMWPRHTGDFSIFRVYADKDGKPADYSKDNIPYKSPVHLKISMNGFQEDDFSMIMGFPGSTQRYMTSYEIDQLLKIDNPNRIHIRGIRQDILKQQMATSDEIRIKYASKYASSSNYWKNSIGMNRGIERRKVKDIQLERENDFTNWIGSDNKNVRYSRALPLIKEAVEGRIPYVSVNQYLSETITRSLDIIRASALSKDLTTLSTLSDSEKNDILEKAWEIYKDYDEATERKVTSAMISLLISDLERDQLPSVIRKLSSEEIDNYVNNLYDNSIFSSYDKFTYYLNNPGSAQIDSDPAVQLRETVEEIVLANNESLKQYSEKYREGHRLYVAGILDMEEGRSHYSDANFTIRLTYGKIAPYSPADAVYYDYYTTLTGVFEKEDPYNPTEFSIPEKLRELYDTKDYGIYSVGGDVPVNFLSTNDITGGNSGSPVLNSKGELIGLAFDGNWEAMSGDIFFEPELQRCINVDIRYVLFIIDKFAGANNIIDELSIVY